MGSNVSLSESVTPFTLPPTLLPLNKKVKVHLVPKFLTSDGTKFDSKYCMWVKVTVLDSTAPNHQNKQQFTANISNAKLTADVEFQHHRFSLGENGNSKRLISRTRSFTLEQSDINIQNVDIIDNESIRISGSFIKGASDINSKDTFDLVLCPSREMEKHTTDYREWLLMGTLFTKSLDSKHKRHWRAAVRASLN